MKLFRFTGSALTDSSGNPIDNPEDIPIAARAETTYASLRLRGRWIVIRCVAAVVGVFLFNAMLRNAKGAAGGLLITCVFVCFLIFIYSLGSYFRFTHTRRILQHNPWVEWRARIAPVTIGSYELTRVVVLSHEDWPTSELRVLSRKKQVRKIFTADEDVTVWAAGSPVRTMVVSDEGGANPFRAWRPRWGFVRSYLNKHATKAVGE